jgi:hypothetical protein
MLICSSPVPRIGCPQSLSPLWENPSFCHPVRLGIERDVLFVLAEHVCVFPEQGTWRVIKRCCKVGGQFKRCSRPESRKNIPSSNNSGDASILTGDQKSAHSAENLDVALRGDGCKCRTLTKDNGNRTVLWTIVTLLTNDNSQEL